MSVTLGKNLLLDRMAGTGTILHATLLELEEPHPQRDGLDQLDRSVVLVGSSHLGESDAASAFRASVLRELREGFQPDGVHVTVHKPAAARFYAEALWGLSREVMAHGGRGSGKTWTESDALAGLAEWHLRAGYPAPLRVQWLHDSLTNAAAKTGASLQEVAWGGLWELRDDSRIAVLMVAGTELVVARFIGCNDQTSAELLRSACHVVCTEEVIATFSDGGIAQQDYLLAQSSMIGRLKTRRHVSLATTNPGAPESWPYQRFLAPGSPGCVAVAIPSTERLTPEELAQMRALYRDAPELEKRLVLGEWVGVQLGEVVATGFFRERHVAPTPLVPVPNSPFLFGGDGGLTPSTVIAQQVGDELRILAALCSERAGTRQHVENLILPWLASHAPWMTRASATITFWYDPAMDTPDQSNLESSPVSVIREVLQCATEPGPMSWPGRRDPLLRMLTQLNPRTGRPRLQRPKQKRRKRDGARAVVNLNLTRRAR